MRRLPVVIALIFTVSTRLFAQEVVPFKLGTFEDSDGTYLGLVLEDRLIVHIEQANQALAGAKPTIPGDMTGLITQYDGLRDRLHAIARTAASMSGAAYIKDVSAVDVRPPMMPHVIYNAASNYALHDAEMARRSNPQADLEPTPPAPNAITGIWEREPDDIRQNPYMFLKLPNTIIADGEAIRVPPGRPNLDWECELAVVIGKTASRVSVADAEDYIFGYTLENDVSDRGGRGDGRMGGGPDWFLQKNHDTFAPFGPYIVPKEFVDDPLNLKQTLTMSGEVMQDSNTGNMTHDIYDMLSYVSHVITMTPGDVYALGSPSGVGTARVPPIYMQAGDTAVCEIEGIGVLTNPVVAWDE